MIALGRKPNLIKPGPYLERDVLDKHVLHLNKQYARPASRRLNRKINAVQHRDALDALVLSETKEDTENRAEPSYSGFLSKLNAKLRTQLEVNVSGDNERAVFEQLRTALLQTDCEDERTSILKRLPTQDIHRMQPGSEWIGDFISATVIQGALDKAGVTISSGDRFFDYGCSSGSLLRLLAYVYDDVSFVGTDPVRSSIDWARTHLTFDNLEFHHQDQTAPIQALPNESVDIASAVSIFSHHGMRACQQWLKELHRVLKTGGVAVITTHGIGSIRYYNRIKYKPLDRYKRLALHLLANGYAFEEVWLQVDDVGNTATEADWGTTFYSQKKMRQILKSHFEVLFYASRMNQGNQDVYVIRKT
ncbi:methyltransferase domain-containing protein [Aliiroseovarius sp. 2305UL8-7]|uniref:methyltransferase domain-containing protein n=1 Tax=Aliiroseovarius conchicola TaxID=3121637 RepID=UPI003528BA90